jgi:hypothetical protein
MLEHEVELIERLLENKSKKYSMYPVKFIYQRGYLVGLLAQLANNDSAVKNLLMQQLTKSSR